MQRKTLPATFLLIAVAFGSAADDLSALRDPRKPWNWTAAERVKARRDPTQRDRRIATYRQRAGTPGPVADVIDGSATPELFFPGELFEYLVRSSFVTLPQAYPGVVRQRTSDLFRETMEWETFRAITAGYASVLADEQAALRRGDARAISALQDRKCAAAADAFRAARQAFGRERFDRMLYEVVPVSIKVSYSRDTNFEVVLAKALERESRCQ